MSLAPNALARELFGGIAPGYDRWAEVFSLLQYRRWRSALLATLAPRPGERILDVSTGTGAVAIDLAAQGCAVVGLDLSRAMLSEALRRAAGSVQLVEGQAEALPFPAATFDAVTFTFLLRYVGEPAQPIKEIARVLRDGGRVAMLEFGVPRFPVSRALWSLYVYALLPLLTRPVSIGWARVGAFLGGSIADFQRRYPLSKLVQDWRDAGLGGVRCRQLSVGGAIIVSGVKL